MVKRYMDCQASDLANLSKEDKLKSLYLSEGRVLVTEVVGSFPPILGDVSNAELACAMGSDIILFNAFDVNDNIIFGIDSDKPLKKAKELTNRLIGVNLEPVFEIDENDDSLWRLSAGRTATMDNIQKLIDQDVDFLVLTGNPGTGVTNQGILDVIKQVKEKFGDKIAIISGKMHAAGSSTEANENLISEKTVKDFIEAGTDIVLIPAPGTIPGFDLKKVKKLIKVIHEYGKMSMTAVGTSQEGSDLETVKNIALMCKMSGTDIHHLGDSGLSPGIASPENITAYSTVIKGKRHTFRRMAKR
ncbi:MAG: haloacid dehalogenase-like hydrolase [Tissierellia bacterium]|nr:haloacid dehalogenase-like hydrolase [Tissierellia bacterium]